MIRVRTLIVAVLLGLGVSASASPAENQPRLVRVDLTPPLSIASLRQAGLDVIALDESGAVLILEWPHDAEALARLGARVTVVDDSPGRTAALRSAREIESRPVSAPRRVWSAARADGLPRFESLPPFGSGSMGGFWTTSEIKMKLDELVANDTQDVVADRVDTLGTSWQGRPIWGLRLAKGVEGPDDRPVAFYNALTHAREPEGMQVLFRFADDLLAKYGTDPFVTSLLDHRVIYLVPLVNPDGYVVNEEIWNSSGGTTFGQWRKNARDNNNNGRFDTSKDGVDINRNYSFRWGKNNGGSSGSQSAGEYRGPSAFSEPESQAQRDAVMQLRPRTGLSFHSFSDLMFHAWGHTDSLAPEVDALHEWSDEITRDNAYQSGGGALGLYLVNGDFGDWCHGDTLLKPRTYMWTPEVGSGADGFYPPPSRIFELADENLRPCYLTAALAGDFVQDDGVEILEGAMNAGFTTHLLLRARNLGTESTGPGLTGTLTALDAGARAAPEAVAWPTLGPRQSASSFAPFVVSLDDTVTPGRLMRFRIDFAAAGGLSSRDTLVVPAGTPTLVFADGASSGLGAWSPGSWGIVTGDRTHPSRYFADSPAGSYASPANNEMTLSAGIDLSAGVHAYALYEARWEIEKDFDGASVLASLDGNQWTRLWSTGTTPGMGPGSLQLAGEPFYAGTRWQWKPERADLSAFTGGAAHSVRLRFWFLSNCCLGFDGFNFDSLRVVVYDPAVQPVPVALVGSAPPIAFELSPAVPDPARTRVRFEFAQPGSGRARLEVLDVQGRRVRTLVDAELSANRYVYGWDLRDEDGRRAPSGVYFARLAGAVGERVRRFVVLE